VHRLAIDERRATASLIASLAELDARRLYLAEGYSSLFTYCTRLLHLSEHAAYGRIEAARVARKYPVCLERLAAGDLTLTTIGLLAPHLTSENHLYLVETARHKGKRDVEHLVATLRPQPAAPSVVRRLPPSTTARPPEAVQTCPDNPLLPRLSTPVSSAPAFTEPKVAPALVRPVAPERYKVQFTLSRETFEKLRRVQDLMRHTCPDGDVGIVFERALTMLLQHLEETKLAHVSRPQRPRGTTSGSRRIPSAVRRAVWTRDDASARSSVRGDDVRSVVSSSFITSYRLPIADSPLSTTFSCAVEPTISTSWTGGSVLRIPLSCVSAATFRAGRTRSGPSRRSCQIAARPVTAVGDKKCQNFSLASVISRLASAGCLCVTDRLGAHSRSVTGCAAH